MTDKPIKISDTGRAMLTLASTREDRLVYPPTLPGAAARQAVRSLLNAGLIEEVAAPADEAGFFWRAADDGTQLALRATELGMRALEGSDHASADAPTASDEREGTGSGDAPPGSVAAVVGEAEATGVTAAVASQGATQADTGSIVAKTTADAPGMPEAPVAPQTPATRLTLRQAAEHLLQVWDAAEGAPLATALEGSIAALRRLLTRAPAATTDGTRKPRENTKQSQVLAMLRRPEGATVAQIAEAMQWAPHTVRGFFAGLKKRQGISVTPERVQQVGTEGAKGSHTIYRLVEVG